MDPVTSNFFYTSIHKCQKFTEGWSGTASIKDEENTLARKPIAFDSPLKEFVEYDNILKRTESKYFDAIFDNYTDTLKALSEEFKVDTENKNITLTHEFRHITIKEIPCDKVSCNQEFNPDTHIGMVVRILEVIETIKTKPKHQKGPLAFSSGTRLYWIGIKNKETGVFTVKTDTNWLGNSNEREFFS